MVGDRLSSLPTSAPPRPLPCGYQETPRRKRQPWAVRVRRPDSSVHGKAGPSSWSGHNASDYIPSREKAKPNGNLTTHTHTHTNTPHPHPTPYPQAPGILSPTLSAVGYTRGCTHAHTPHTQTPSAVHPQWVRTHTHSAHSDTFGRPSPVGAHTHTHTPNTHSQPSISHPQSTRGLCPGLSIGC